MGRKEMYINIVTVVDLEAYSNTLCVFNVLLLSRIVYAFLKI